MTRIVIYFAPGNNRSELVAKAMHRGIIATGSHADLKPSTSYRGEPQHDVAIFYGFASGLRRVFDDYRRRRRAVYIDLGYWGRRKRTRWDGYHKLVLNSRHPTAYFQDRAHSHDRFLSHGVKVEPWRRSGQHIILAGMSAKAAYAEGFKPEEWERAAIEQLRKYTDRPIIYRPKPNWPEARPLPFSTMQADVPLERALKNCHAVVTHHSNVGIDAVLAGVPVITIEGAVEPMAGTALSLIENPPMPEGREQWAADLAYCQWSMEEIERGLAFRYLRDEGLIP